MYTELNITCVIANSKICFLQPTFSGSLVSKNTAPIFEWNDDYFSEIKNNPPIFFKELAIPVHFIKYKFYMFALCYGLIKKYDLTPAPFSLTLILFIHCSSSVRSVLDVRVRVR
mgnify:CR=1 FL=1